MTWAYPVRGIHDDTPFPRIIPRFNSEYRELSSKFSEFGLVNRGHYCIGIKDGDVEEVLARCMYHRRRGEIVFTADGAGYFLGVSICNSEVGLYRLSTSKGDFYTSFVLDESSIIASPFYSYYNYLVTKEKRNVVFGRKVEASESPEWFTALTLAVAFGI